jgi:hypothetical protein
MAGIELVPDPELAALWPGSSGAAIVVTTHSGQRFEKLSRCPPEEPIERSAGRK